MNNQSKLEKHLRVFENRSEYFMENGEIKIFLEGTTSNDAKKRIKLIKDAFENGYLEKIINEVKNGKTTVDLTKISSLVQNNIRQLVDSITSEVGRALIGLIIMQLSIKAISPNQSIRLHKSSSNAGSFSWIEGISMRTLDKNYVTPTLRRHELVRLNADGFMMTRSLAENYPYSLLYKAKLRGARDQWLMIVEELELGTTNSEESLKYLISLLFNAANIFADTAENLIECLKNKIDKFKTRWDVIKIMKSHSEKSDYAARLLEISMHTLMQPSVDCGALGDVSLKPLSQMRSANKKHGNIGDVELLENYDIIESWDAKYGKSYLREEIEEAAEKIKNHGNLQTVGFVTNIDIQRIKEVDNRIEDLSSYYGVKFKIVKYEDWVDYIYDRCIKSSLIDEVELSKEWIESYVLTLSQRKRLIAPIDEPCIEWVKSLIKEFKSL